MNPIEAKKTKLNTDFPMDKIAGYAVGSVVADASFPTFPEIPHGLLFTPLAIVKWSDDPAFSVSYDEIGVSFNFVTLNAQTDSSKLYLFINNLTSASKTLYYRIIYFMPTNVDVEALPTQQSLDAFVLNTDYNYPKIYEQNYVASSAFTVDHNLGYYPQVEAWYVRSSDGKVIHVVSGSTFSEDPRVKVTTTSVSLLNGTLGITGWHYKIYLDEM